MYDYEFYPQKVSYDIWANGTHLKRIYECLASPWEIHPQRRKTRLHVKIKFSQSSVFYSNFLSFFQECDAIIITSSYAYESVSSDTMKQWFSDLRKEVHVLGPLLPADFGTESQNNEEGASVDIETFLGEMHGKRSVIFVRSFSLWRIQLQIFSSGFLWYSPLDVNFGIRWRVDWSPDWKEKAPFVYIDSYFPFVIQAHYSVRFLLLRPHVPNYRSNWQKESSHQVWECVPKAIHFWITRYYIPNSTCPGRILRIKIFHRRLDGSLHMEVLIALLNLFGVVSPCKVFLRSTTHLGIYLFVEFAGHFLRTSQLLTENLNVAFE